MNKKILIVDDEEDILEAITLLLEFEGYTVRTVADGKQTLKNIEKFQPDVILLDVLISGSDGRDICRDLKENKSTKNLPIIMMSAHPNVSSEAIDCGANEFITKPFETELLLNTINKYVN